jgi:dephospho-CoA kinase
LNIIGITGTIGSGKGTIVEYLISKHNYKHYSVRDYLTKLLVEKGLEPDRANMASLANELRKKHSPSFIVEELYRLATTEHPGNNCIIESIRAIGEVKKLREKPGFVLFAVDAESRLRYQRIKQRKSSTDRVSFKMFLEDEAKEMAGRNPNEQNLHACIELADFNFVNNGSFEDLYAQVEKVLNELNNKP